VGWCPAERICNLRCQNSQDRFHIYIYILVGFLSEWDLSSVKDAVPFFSVRSHLNGVSASMLACANCVTTDLCWFVYHAPQSCVMWAHGSVVV